MPNIQAEQVILDTYDPRTGEVQWADIIPQGVMPGGKLFIMRTGEWKPNDVLSRYMTHLSMYDIAKLPENEQAPFWTSTGKGYFDVPITPTVLSLPGGGPDQWIGTWPDAWNLMYFPNGPLTEQQGLDKSNIASLNYPVAICETMENLHALDMKWPFWKVFWKNWRRRLDEKFGAENVFLNYDYLHGFIENVVWIGRQAAKDRLRAPINTWPGNPMLPGGNCEDCNLGCYPIYYGGFDYARDVTFNFIYSCMLAHKAGKKQIAYMANIHEQRPNNYHLFDLPNGGKFARHDKVPVSPALVIIIVSAAYIFGDGAVGWLFGGKSTQEKRWSRPWLQGNELYWKPGEANPSDLSTFPYLTPSDREYYTTYTGVEDVAAMTMAALGNTWGLTQGGAKGFCKFRVNGGAWINAANADADDIVDGQWDKRGVLYYQMLGNTLSWWYHNPYADNTIKTVEFEHPTVPGLIYSIQVATYVAKFGNVNF